MTLRELVLKNRSYRRFYEEVSIDTETLREWIDLGRLAPSGRNVQPIKYTISNEPALNAMVFETLAWAGYLPEWQGPEQGERPAAYIVQLGDKEIAENYYGDNAYSAQNILLGAVEKGFGGCIIASVKRKELRTVLNIPEQYEILNVLALGKPKENVIITEIDSIHGVKYYRDKDKNHYVPKRSLDEIILKF